MPQKAMYWQQQEALVIADLHLGKVAHFRKEGFAIPQGAGAKNYELLTEMLGLYPARKCIFLGDLFHSVANADWLVFMDWMKLFPEVEMILVKGNHDILPQDFYEAGALTVYNEQLELGPFLFTHIPLEADQLSTTDRYVFAGHIHPGVNLYGKGRQIMKLPCFLLGKQQALLPAFGSFTGLGIIQPQPNDEVYVVAGDKVIRIIT